MPRYRCPRCSLEVEAGTPRQLCSWCGFAGVFARASRGVPTAALEDPPPAGQRTPRIPAPQRAPAVPPPAPPAEPVPGRPRPPVAFQATSTPSPRAPAPPRRQRLGGWLAGLLVRWMGPERGGEHGGGRGRGRRGGGPGLARLLPPVAVLAALAAGTSLGIVVVEAVRTGSLAHLRADRPRVLPLATVAALAAMAGWWEWLRHKGARWGLFARGLGAAAASLGAVCLGGLLGDWFVALLKP